MRRRPPPSPREQQIADATALLRQRRSRELGRDSPDPVVDARLAELGEEPVRSAHQLMNLGEVCEVQEILAEPLTRAAEDIRTRFPQYHCLSTDMTKRGGGECYVGELNVYDAKSYQPVAHVGINLMVGSSGDRAQLRLTVEPAALSHGPLPVELEDAIFGAVRRNVPPTMEIMVRAGQVENVDNLGNQQIVPRFDSAHAPAVEAES